MNRKDKIRFEDLSGWLKFFLIIVFILMLISISILNSEEEEPIKNPSFDVSTIYLESGPGPGNTPPEVYCPLGYVRTGCTGQFKEYWDTNYKESIYPLSGEGCGGSALETVGVICLKISD